ncbi:MAG: CDP-alcohol phosphatidyltransferase family protein [Capnocytophaga sp.]|nr:CDP-alcohol phosphatidyltransferase family protein [Capnocytophaga sp.]
MKKHIPNFLTLLNLFCGLIALQYASIGYFKGTLFWIFLGIVFDFFDGFVARMLKVSSPLGLQLDSLADMVTSGVVPGQVMFLLISNVTPSYGGFYELIPFSGFLITLASAYRLAKFNIDTRQTSSFIGLPTPANALFIVGLGVGQMDDNLTFFYLPLWGLLSITLLSCYLLNSEIELFALKFKDFSLKNNAIKYLFLVISIILLLIFKVLGIPLIIVAYILLSVFMKITKKL